MSSFVSVEVQPQSSPQSSLLPRLTGVPAGLYVILKIFGCGSKLFALSHPDAVAPLLLLSEATNCFIPILWTEISLAFQGVIFEEARSKLQAPDTPDIKQEEAIKANRKSTSLPDICKLLLELSFDQYTASFVVFTKVGCGRLLACGAAFATILFPTIFQLAPRSRVRIREYSNSKRRKENEREM